MAEPIDEELEVGEPGHVPHHIALAQAVNEHDVRITDLEDGGGGEGGSSQPTTVGYWEATTISAEDLAGELPSAEGRAFLLEAAPDTFLVGFAAVDINGTDWSSIFPYLPAGARITARNPLASGTVTRLTVGSPPFILMGDWYIAGVTLTGSTDVFTDNVGTNILVFIELFGAGSGSDLDQVLGAGDTAINKYIVLHNSEGTAETLIQIGSISLSTADNANGAYLGSSFISMHESAGEEGEDGYNSRSASLYYESISGVKNTQEDGNAKSLEYNILFPADTLGDDDEAWSYQLPNKSGDIAVGKAGLDTVGWPEAVFIEHGGTVPEGISPYTIVIELEA